ncbi:MAG TPA: hypothetical protein VJY15_11285 [Candidatus Acidoferrum sp.]|nr:hypothetical protein [Candidatus Acidoferrum sp.]
MTTEDFVRLVRDVQSDFEREEDQGLLQRDLHKAEQALAGKYACGRILRAIEAREGIQLVGRHRAGRAR